MGGGRETFGRCRGGCFVRRPLRESRIPPYAGARERQEQLVV